MSRLDRRWSWLTCFALANLVCWVAMAGALGLVVGDRVDLGVETFVRREQATAVAIWDRAFPGPFRPTPEGSPIPALAGTIAQAPSAAQTAPAGSRVSPATAQPQATAPAALGQIAGDDSPGNASGLGGTPDNPQNVIPEATLVSSPLLLADPEINSLRLLEAELGRSASARPVQIRYGEEALNREIGALSKNNPDLPFRNVQVDLKRDRVIITGRVTILGFQVNAEITGRVRAQDCRPSMEIETVSAAGVMTPEFVKDQVEQMMLEAIAWYPADYPLCLEQIVLEEARATVYGYRR